MNPDIPSIDARTASFALAGGGLLALGAFALTRSPDLLAQVAWVYCAALLLVASPPPRRRALFAVLLTFLIALIAALQDALGHDASGATAVAQMAGVWAAYAVIRLAGVGPRPESAEEITAASGLSSLIRQV